MTPQRWFAIGAALAGLAVLAGALGDHALSQHLLLPNVFQTAQRYQTSQSLGLMLAALAVARWPNNWTQSALWLLLVGTLLFSSSLYLLSLTGTHAFGFITPFGGVSLMVGWACLAIGAWRGAD